MIRKMISMGLCSAGVLALLSAGDVQAQETSRNQGETSKFITATIGADFAKLSTSTFVETEVLLPLSGDTVPADVAALMGGLTGTGETVVETTDEAVEETTEEATQAPAEETATQESVETPAPVVDQIPYIPGTDEKLLVNGAPVSLDTRRTMYNDMTYVSVSEMSKALDSSAVTSWDGSSVTVQTDKMTLVATVNQSYILANGRYLYLEDGVKFINEIVIAPIGILMEAFDATLVWEEATETCHITTGSGAIQSGDSFYDADELFWMSRVIFAESGNQSLKGQMAVGNVVLNRVARSQYPSTILGVIAQANQFSVYQNGALANRTPSATSVIAAKLVLDGGVVSVVANATHFDSLAVSWASRNLRTMAVIGGHTFYG